MAIAPESDARLEVPGGVPQLRDARDDRLVVTQQRTGHVDAQLLGDDVRRQNRGRGEQLVVVDDVAVRGERHPRLLLPRLAVDRGDVDVSRLTGGVEAGKPAGLRRPRQHQVVAGGRLAVGVDRVVGDLVVEHQRRTANYRDRAEVVVGHDLAVGAVVAESGQRAREGLRSRRRRAADGVGVVGVQRAVDDVVDLSGGASGAPRQRARRGCRKHDHQPADRRPPTPGNHRASVCSACRSDAHGGRRTAVQVAHPGQA